MLTRATHYRSLHAYSAVRGGGVRPRLLLLLLLLLQQLLLLLLGCCSGATLRADEQRLARHRLARHRLARQRDLPACGSRACGSRACGAQRSRPPLESAPTDGSVGSVVMASAWSVCTWSVTLGRLGLDAKPHAARAGLGLRGAHGLARGERRAAACMRHENAGQLGCKSERATALGTLAQGGQNPGQAGRSAYRSLMSRQKKKMLRLVGAVWPRRADEPLRECMWALTCDAPVRAHSRMRRAGRSGGRHAMRGAPESLVARTADSCNDAAGRHKQRCLHVVVSSSPSNATAKRTVTRGAALEIAKYRRRFEGECAAPRWGEEGRRGSGVLGQS